MAITFIGAGTAAFGNNASVSPTIHASTAVGDLKLVFASIRNSGTGTVDTPAGWAKVVDFGNAAILGKFHEAGDAAPTVTFAGGVANADTIGQSATWRGVEPTLTGILAATLLNGSAQNITYPALTIPDADCLIVLAGWKQDDYTSVAGAIGTEIQEASTVTGDDASQIWNYVIQTTATNVASASFTVTGGASAISRGIVLALRPAAAITAVEQDSWPPRVLVSVTGLTLGDNINLYRRAAGERTLVRGGAHDAVTDPSFLRTDAELPFGILVSYLAVINDAAEYTTAGVIYTLTGGKVALSDAINGNAAEVIILAWDEKAHDRRSTVYQVGGRNVAVLGDLPMFSGDIELFTEATSARDNLHALIRNATQGVIQIRQPGGYDGVDSYAAVLGVRERRFSQDGSDDRRTHVLSVAETEGWAAALLAAGFTLQDIADVYDAGTLDDIDDDFATLLEIAQGEFLT